MPHSEKPAGDIRRQLQETIAHLEHVLPGQAPIQDFVHHNTLHGFQRLPFRQAIAESQRITGNRGYMAPERCRRLFAAGRIDREDLDKALDQQPELQADRLLLERAGRRLQWRDIYLGALLHPLPAVTACQLNWQIEELDALARFQPDVDRESRHRLLANAGCGESAAIGDLWAACLEVLGLEHFILHPEELVDLDPDQALRMLSQLRGESPDEQATLSQQINREAAQRLQALLERVGPELTLTGLLRELTGENLTEQQLPLLIRPLASHLDQGLAPWNSTGRKTGFYASWRAFAAQDLPVLQNLHAWRDELGSLPDDPMDAMVAELRRLGLEREHWGAYLERLALEIPGWSGMVLWRSLHPSYEGLPAPVEMNDYLAVRLVLERIFAQRLCRRLWQIEASLDLLRWYFRRNGAELMVRLALYAERLPEFLASRAQRAAADSDLERGAHDWQRAAGLIWTWRQSPATDQDQGYSVFRSAWPLFRLAQHLGLTGDELRALGDQGAARILDCLARLDEQTSGYTWLLAYEHHYREQILTALAQNRSRGRWARRDQPPAGQVMFCMDDREEGIRRHLEELAPELETLGAAAHFSVPHSWRGLDAEHAVALAPVIPAPVIPVHQVCETARDGRLGAAHSQRHRQLEAGYQGLLQHTRRGLLAPAALLPLGAPLALASLLGKVFAPAPFHRAVTRLRGAIEGRVPTRIRFATGDDSPEGTPEHPRPGFTDAEQAERVEALLRSSGLTYGFAPLVLILGHGSRNQNNPHAPAYNCGACSGRFSGPNARLVANMANRPEVRALLAQKGIEIPDGSWFLGGEHDTCLDRIELYDLEDLPPALAPALQRLQEPLAEAARLHAQERCRRFASAPTKLDPPQAQRHVEGRAWDFSQARPELGHATNACALIGRRSMSRGAFFDRRAFLISYDPTQDPDGSIIERHLLTNGAVGAGISLEYYFSSVDNPGHGAGTKITHNLTGWLGVMEGTGSDLRTGLPQQMIEIHEPMRLLVVVEQSTELLTAVYRRQPPLQELVGNGWVQLAAMDPESGAIHRFDPEAGWQPWQPTAGPVPLRDRSFDCYAGASEALPPALIRAPDHLAAG